MYLLEIVLNYWVDIHLLAHKFWGLSSGASFLLAWKTRKYSMSKYLTALAVLSAFTPIIFFFFLPQISDFVVGTSYSIPQIHFWWFLGGCLVAPLVWLTYSRYVLSAFAYLFSLITRKFTHQRDSRTDIRNVSNTLPKPLKKPFNPEKYFKDQNIFIGLNEKLKPLYIPINQFQKSHIQIAGTTGSGKGVLAGSILFQASQLGEAVIAIDPKDDEFLASVLYKAAKTKRVPFVFLDLRGQDPQWNPLFEKSEQEIEELLSAGFQLAEKGEAADFYRLDDRKATRSFAKYSATKSGSLNSKFVDFYMSSGTKPEDAKKFYNDLQEIAETSCANAEKGLDIDELLESKAVIYVRGSTRNPRILKLQRIFLISCVQHVEKRKREQANQVLIFLDEFKYLISRAALEALGTIRDKRAHLILAHQSLGDLKDCASDLNPEAVTGAVIDNCSIKIVYKVQDPETAKWFSELSGKILVDDETRVIERNFGLTELQTPQRTLRQAESPLVDINKLLMLPERCAVVFGLGSAQFIYTSPVPIEKRFRPKEEHPEPGAPPISAADQTNTSSTQKMPSISELLDVD